MDPVDFEEKALEVSTLLKAMSNEYRLLILCLLMDGERTVSGLTSEVGLSQSAVSQHLAVLRRSHMVKTRRDARSIYYSLALRQPAAIIGTLCRLFATDGNSRPRRNRGTIGRSSPS